MNIKKNSESINFLIVFLISTMCLSLIPLIAGAANHTSNDARIRNTDDILKVLSKVVEFVYQVFFIVAILYILFAAFTFLTAQASPEKILTAKKQLIYAAIAIVVALVSVGASQIILSLFP